MPPILLARFSTEGVLGGSACFDERPVMTKGETSSTFRAPSEMSVDEKRSFNRWLINNAVIGSVVAAGLVAIVVIGPTRPSHFSTSTQNVSVMSTDISALAKGD